MIQIQNISEIKKLIISNLRAVIFDLDDTLYPLNEYVQSDFRQSAACFSDIVRTCMINCGTHMRGRMLWKQ